MKLAAAAIAGIAAAATGFLVVSVTQPDPDAVPTPEQVSHRTMSPFCPGLNLEECPSPQAADLRFRIAERVRNGDTNAEIDAWLVSEYGEAVAGRPRSAASWAVPLIGTAGAAAGVIAFVNTRRRPAGMPEIMPVSEDEKARLAEDLKRFAETTE